MNLTSINEQINQTKPAKSSPAWPTRLGWAKTVGFGWSRTRTTLIKPPVSHSSGGHNDCYNFARLAGRGWFIVMDSLGCLSSGFLCSFLVLAGERFRCKSGNRWRENNLSLCVNQSKEHKRRCGANQRDTGTRVGITKNNDNFLA